MIITMVWHNHSLMIIMKNNLTTPCCIKRRHHTRGDISEIVTDFYSYASAELAMGLCPCLSVCVCVCLSQAGVLLKRQNVGSHKQHRTIPEGLSFSGAKDLREIRPGSPPTGATNAGGVGQNRRLLTNNRLYIENCTR